MSITGESFINGVAERGHGAAFQAWNPTAGDYMEGDFHTVDRVQIELRVAEDDIQAIAHTLSATTIDSVRLVKGEIQFGSEISVFGIPFTVGIGVEPFADGGSIGFTPTGVEIAGTRSSAESLIKQFGRPAEQLLKTQSICVAQWLPAALGVETVEVGTKRLTVTIGATKALFDEKSLASVGSCD